MSVGLVVGGLTAWLAVLARRAFDPPTTVPGFVRRGVLLPRDVAADAVVLARLLVTGHAFRREPGRVDRLRLHDDEAVRAWAVLLTSAAPGTLAVDVEERGKRLVLHRHLLTGSSRATAELGHR